MRNFAKYEQRRLERWTACRERFERALARPQFKRAFADGDYSDTFENLHAAARYVATALLWVSRGDSNLALRLFNECPLSKRIDPVKALGHAQRDLAEKAQRNEAGRAA